MTKLRWFAEHEPDLAARTQRRCVLPHDWLTAQILGSAPRPAGARPPTAATPPAPATGRRRRGAYRPTCSARVRPRARTVPRVAGPAEAVGEHRGRAGSSAPAPATTWAPRSVSASARRRRRLARDQRDGVRGGGGTDRGRERARRRLRRRDRPVPAAGVHPQRGPGARRRRHLLGADLAGLDELALSATPGAGGLTLLPYLDGERTPDLPDATGTARRAHPGERARRRTWRGPPSRACCAASPTASTRCATTASRSSGCCSSAAPRGPRRCRRSRRRSSGRRCRVPRPGEYVALGAARQAAWVLARSRGHGAEEPPGWAIGAQEVPDPGGDWAAEVRGAYARLRGQMHDI